MFKQKNLVKRTNSGRIALSTAIPQEQWEEAQANGWKWNDLILTGIQAKKNLPGIMKRITELEDDARGATEKIRTLAMKNNEMLLKINELTKK